MNLAEFHRRVKEIVRVACESALVAEDFVPDPLGDPPRAGMGGVGGGVGCVCVCDPYLPQSPNVYLTCGMCTLVPMTSPSHLFLCFRINS